MVVLELPVGLGLLEKVNPWVAEEVTDLMKNEEHSRTSFPHFFHPVLRAWQFPSSCLV